MSMGWANTPLWGAGPQEQESRRAPLRREATKLIPENCHPGLHRLHAICSGKKTISSVPRGAHVHPAKSYARGQWEGLQRWRAGYMEGKTDRMPWRRWVRLINLSINPPWAMEGWRQYDLVESHLQVGTSA
eukprot:GGOE01008191.1.p4 GENE.GGOE01008191.1~~GGOE01008191.1.p4  ORF type:complete len:131 (+),score=6.12 GGOE01008191.1:704-1096(+)